MENKEFKESEDDLKNAKAKLYYNLRNEINDKLKRIESMSTFCITTMIAVYAFVFKEEDVNSWLLLLPLVLVVMVSYRAANNDLGGDSLLAISLLNHLENTFGTEITIKDILENPVLENLAKCIDNAGKKTQKIAAKSNYAFTTC